MTVTVFLRRSGWLIGLLILTSSGGIALLAWLNSRVSASATDLDKRTAETQLVSLARSFNTDERSVLAATVPTEPALAQVYASFEALATRHQATLRYDFTGTPAHDPVLIQAETAKDSWVIPIDFLGTQTSLEAIFRELETGPYLVKLHTYRFDITDPVESLLSTTLILYGR